MSFKEKLRDEILPKAVGYFNSGIGMNESVVKAAQDFSLNMDQVDRLVETMNTARTIAHYEKNAEDRTGSFDVADKMAVRRMLYSSGEEKSASAPPDSEPAGSGWFDYSSYDVPEFDRRRRTESSGLFEKAAEENASDDTVKALTSRQKVDALAKKASDLSRIAGGIEDAIGMLRDAVETKLCKIASSLCRGYDAENRYAVFSVSCGKLAPDVAKAVSDRIPGRIVKSAGAAIRGMLEENVVDDSSVSDELAMAEEVVGVFEKISSALSMVERIRSTESDARRMMSKLAQSPWFGSGGQGGQGGHDGHDGHDGHEGQGGQGGGNGAGAGGGGKSNKNSGKRGGGDDSGYADSILKYFTLGKIDEGTIDELVGRKDHETGIQDYVDNIRRSAILEDLVANDPILSESSPKDVVNAYRTLVQSAPSMSLNKEVVRAVLRQVVNSVAVSPFDAKQWADYESTYNKNKSIGSRV